MKQRIRKLCMGVSLLLSLCLAGCGMFSPLDGGAVKEADSTSLESDGLIVVGFAQIGSESVWRTANTASACALASAMIFSALCPAETGESD